jgi:hypothetical protein
MAQQGRSQQQQQQQRVQLGACSNSSSGSLDAHAAGSDATAGGRGDAGAAAACEGGETLPIEVAWEAWLHQLLFELLLMLSMVRLCCAKFLNPPFIPPVHVLCKHVCILRARTTPVASAI